jgi:hypothetical protein
MGQLTEAVQKVRSPKRVASRAPGTCSRKTNERPPIAPDVCAETKAASKHSIKATSRIKVIRRSIELAVSKIGTPEGEQELAAYLKTLPFPHFEEDAQNPQMLVQIEKDGTRTHLRFVNHQFEPVP